MQRYTRRDVENAVRRLASAMNVPYGDDLVMNDEQRDGALTFDGGPGGFIVRTYVQGTSGNWSAESDTFGSTLRPAREMVEAINFAIRVMEHQRQAVGS